MSAAGFPINPAAIVIQADRFDLLRCRCAVCGALDRRFVGQGWQLRFPLRELDRERFTY